VTDKSKRRVRDVQDQTGWNYQQTVFLIQQLGYGKVTEEIDRVLSVGDPTRKKLALEELLKLLAMRARQAQKDRPQAAPGTGCPHGAAEGKCHVSGCANRGQRPAGVVTVRARCVACRAERDIGAGEVPEGEMPACKVCFSPMVAISASARTR
jgi:hypothetical protein